MHYRGIRFSFSKLGFSDINMQATYTSFSSNLVKKNCKILKPLEKLRKYLQACSRISHKVYAVVKENLLRGILATQVLRA